MQDVPESEADGHAGKSEDADELAGREAGDGDDQGDEQADQDDRPVGEPAHHHAEVVVPLVASGDGAHRCPDPFRHEEKDKEDDDGEREVRQPLKEAVDHRLHSGGRFVEIEFHGLSGGWSNWQDGSAS